MQPPYAPNVVNQTVSYGGQTWKGNPGQGWTPENSGGSGGNNVDVIGNAQKLLDFQKKANEPVVTALQGQQPGLDQKYKDLVASIKGNQTLDTNRQTVTTNNELGKRGITGDSGIAQRELTNALTPIDTQYSGLMANTTAGSISDTQALATQIAQLQAGNPDTAISGAGNWAGLQNQASQIAAQNAFNYGQANYYNSQVPYYAALTSKTNASSGSNVPAIDQIVRQAGGYR